MAINLSDNINSNSPKILDKRYGPWSSVNDANTNVPSPQRAQGLTVGILSGSGIVEYWYYSGTTDTDLIFKTGGGSGIAGTSGTSGTSGIDGTSGTSGIDGTSGTSGVSGTSGTSGVSGTSGTSGVSGTSGTSGIDGTSGTSGIDGTSGTSGISGTSGTSGIDGTSGTSGISGTSGTSGIDGTSGTSGSSGTSGTSPGSVYDELYYDSDTKTLHVPNIALTGSTIIASNLPIASEDPQNRLVLSGDTIYLLTGATTGSTNINLLEYGGLDVVSGDTYFTRFDSSLDASLSVPNTIGGIAAGTTVADLTGKTLVQLFNDLLFPTVQPTYTIPSIAMTGPSNATVEAGSTYTASISGYGNKNDAGQFTQLRIVRNSSPLQTYTGAGLTQSSITDIAAQFGYVDPNNPNYRYTINPTPYSESYVIPSGAPSTTTYYVDGNYDAGLAKQDNKGNYDVRTPALRSSNAPQTAGTGFQSTSATLTGLIPYFWGTFDTGTTVTKELIASAISGGTANKVLAAASGTLSIPYNIPSDWKYIWVAYPAIYTTKTKWFVSVFDSGDIDGTFITTAVTQNVDSPNGYWSGISFKMHWSVNATIQSTFEYRN